jgi:hypothetical protein
MIFYGSKGKLLAQAKINGTICQHCHEPAPQNISTFGKYAHIYWIPFFPIGKVGVAECTNCKRTIEKKEFTPQLLSKYKELSHQHKTPLWFFSGPLAIIGIMACFNLMSLFGPKEIPDPRKDLLKEDMSMMVSNPDSTMTFASLIHTLVKVSVESPMDFDKIKYLNKKEADKQLFIMKFPSYKDFTNEDRESIFSMVKTIVESDTTMLDSDRYIGIHGKYNFMAVKSPNHEEVSRIVSEKHILDFYGDPPSVNESE